MNCVTISEELLAFRQRVAGCYVVAFADLSTGMVLASSTSEKVTQEKLDQLCAAGFDALVGPKAACVAQQVGASASAGPHMAVVATDLGVECFVRSCHPAQEALCFRVSERVHLDALFNEAFVLLERLVGEV